MPEITPRPVKITETVLRDGHQSLIATRMTTEQMLPIIEEMDKVGYYSVECWGGATFDASLRFLSEDPWERLRKIRAGFKNTKLQMLFRAQNILGYRHYADDVVDYFVKKSLDNGIDIIRIFDALNDLRNLETAVNATKKYGGHVQTAISYTLGEPYTIEYFTNLAKSMENMGADSICVKDMAGLLIPYEAEKLVKALKATVSVPIQLHTHYTSGVAAMSYMRGVEAGADIIDTAMSPFALGTSQPSTEVMVRTFRGTPYDTGLNEEILLEVADYFRPIREEALASGLLNPKVLGVDINTLKYQVPGGMLSNLVSQLKDQHAEDKFYDVLKEIPRVREDMGMPPLVTPSSQIVGTQAVMNVLFGGRYKVATKETKALLHGEYGQTVRPFNKEVQKMVIGDAEPITCRPADLIENELPKLREEIKDYSIQDEDVLTYALFPQVALDFFKERQAGFPKKKAAEEAAKTAKEAAEAAKNAPKAAPKADAPAQIKYVPLPAPFLHSYPGVVGEAALPYIDPAPKAGDKIEGSATFDGKKVDFKVDCLG
ncbi:MAG: oxaloacetate decarboxylase subunit alpha [Lachnospiraceae bacterium]|nr:oxaloacetate decarboxylase subunit alpha [Lachnospiraceae bacterium]